MSSRPLVSIITPSLDQAAFIERTLRSVEAQTYPHIEHLVYDAGSTDGTLDILRQHERPGLRWVSEPDSGMYDAIARGMREARGEILAYLNTDDLYFPWSVEVAVEHLSAHPDAALVYGDAVIVDEAAGTARLFLQPPFRLEYLLRLGSFAQPATFWRRQAYEAVGGIDGGLRYAGDLDLYIRLGAAGRAHKIDEFLAVMRRHPAMKTIAQADRAHAENARVRARYAGPTSPGPLAMLLERGLAWWARRRALWRFVLAARRRSRDGSGPWGHFLSRGAARISLPRLMLAQLPGLGQRYGDAVGLQGVDLREALTRR